MAILAFENVSFGWHAEQPIMQGVNFALESGRIAAILGPNGAGKTTMLSLILGWLRPWQGQIRLDGKAMSQWSNAERGRQMALVPQTEYTPFDYTLLEYVLLGRAPHLPALSMPTAQDIAIARQAVEQVGLGHLLTRRVPHLSGGERQLMLLARALAQISPSQGTAQSAHNALLLLDEPTAHLDLSNKARLIGIMRQLRQSGVTLLMTNHEPDVVLAVADDVLLMEAGAPILFGSLADVFTAENLSRVYKLPIRLTEIDGRKQVWWS